jgi:hypothetical protein
VRSDTQDSFTQSIVLGIVGPITDQLHFRGEVGRYWSGYGGEGTLWTAYLSHTAGPYTRQDLLYSRYLSSFNEEVNETIGYRISQIFGPKLTGDAFVTYTTIEDLTGHNSDRNQLYAGLRFYLVAGPKTTLGFSGIYGRSDSDFEDIESWIGRFDLAYNFTDTFLARLAYQYTRYDSSVFGNGYYENLLILSATKFFR